ncbi:hypothetical protein BZZ08_03681 [Streptomyces sp. MH60]|nr:hypothetical protein BZZ08_03681 [Streptomyces sp. MH60]
MQGVCEPGGAVVVDGDQSLGLQILQDPNVQGVAVQVQGQGLGEGEAFEGLPLRGAGAVEDVGGALAHRGGDRHRSPPCPLVRVRHPHQPAPLAHGGHQVTQQPQVPAAQAVQPVGGERLQGGVRAGREQFRGLLAGQRFQGEARQQLTGPQPGDRARHGGAVGGDDQEAGAAVHGELVHEGGGGVVEQVGVVHQQQPYAGQEVDRAVQGDPLGQQVGEGGEGDVPGLGRPGGPDAVGSAHGLRHEPGLARARRARHHEAAPSGRHGPAHQLQFVRPAGERPGRLQPLRVPQRSRHGNMSRHTHP